jgi:hypothetical protein
MIPLEGVALGPGWVGINVAVGIVFGSGVGAIVAIITVGLG